MRNDILRRSWKTPRGLPVVMSYREGTNDYNTLQSVLAEDEYGLRDLRLTGLAIDVGAHIGAVSVALAVDNPDLQVLAVEPIPENVALLRLNTSELDVVIIGGAAGDGHEIAIPYGFGGSEIAEHHAWIGGSLLPGDAPHKVWRGHGYSLTELLNGRTAALLKIDCEGGEYLFLADPVIADVAMIVGEAHPFGDKRPSDLVALLSPTHDVTLIGPNQSPGPCGFRAIRR